MNLEQIYNKMRLGDTITDDELRFFVTKLEPTVANLENLGPRFSLAAKELGMFVCNAKTFLQARENREI